MERLFKGEISSILLRDGASIGGARPKMRLCIGADGKFYGGASAEAEGVGAQHWIVKFDASNSGWGTIELAYSRMARAAGIVMPETRLLPAQRPDGVLLQNFAIRRFDRDGPVRHHYHSAAGYYGRSINPLTVQGDYAELLDVLSELGAPVADKEELVRRCVFNVLAHNLDDHFKNFGFCMTPEGAWQLSPAFDLCFLKPDQPWLAALGGRCSTVAGRSREIRAPDILSLCSRANVTQRKGRQIIDQVMAEIARWETYAEAASVPEQRIEEVRQNMDAVLLGF
jgi:serine/threonine-protein kinase HipA